MIDINSQLKIKYAVGNNFTDYTLKATSFNKDSFSMDHVSSTDYFYVGYKKPISSLYFNQATQYEDEGQLTGQYFNGSSWQNINGLSDETISFKRSGFIRWPKAQLNQTASAIDSESMYWYRFKSSVDRLELAVAGINIVFADDYDLSLEQPLINAPEFLGSQTSHILVHSAVKNEIIQKFKNDDYVKQDSSGNLVDINAWDLHDIMEVRLAAVFLALSKIYENMSDSSTDVWAEKSKKYSDKYEKMINIARLSLDLNDDGVEQTEEQKPNVAARYMNR